MQLHGRVPCSSLSGDVSLAEAAARGGVGPPGRACGGHAPRHWRHTALHFTAGPSLIETLLLTYIGSIMM